MNNYSIKSKATYIKEMNISLIQLKEAALSDEEWEVRKAAVKKLTDQGAIKEVALSDEDSVVRKAALEKLTDQDTLKEVALGDEDSDVRDAALEKDRKSVV